jgi:hypothetical protein
MARTLKVTGTLEVTGIRYVLQIEMAPVPGVFTVEKSFATAEERTYYQSNPANTFGAYSVVELEIWSTK